MRQGVPGAPGAGGSLPPKAPNGHCTDERVAFATHIYMTPPPPGLPPSSRPGLSVTVVGTG